MIGQDSDLSRRVPGLPTPRYRRASDGQYRGSVGPVAAEEGQGCPFIRPKMYSQGDGKGEEDLAEDARLLQSRQPLYSEKTMQSRDASEGGGEGGDDSDVPTFDFTFSWRKLWAFTGPGWLMSLAYLDPGERPTTPHQAPPRPTTPHNVHACYHRRLTGANSRPSRQPRG